MTPTLIVLTAISGILLTALLFCIIKIVLAIKAGGNLQDETHETIE
jgi:hypothetical protein